MVHITIVSFHINLHANKRYLVDVDPPPRDSIDNPKFKPWKMHWSQGHVYSV